MKKILVLGVGAQGSTAARKLDQEPEVGEIICADYDQEAVDTLVAQLTKAKGAFVDAHDLNEVENAIQDNTRVIYLETLGNPNSDIPDIDAIAAIAHRHANGLGVGGDGLDVVSSRAAVRHVRDGGIVEGHFRSAPSSRSTKPGACLRSIQRSTVTRSCSGSIQTMWLPQPSAK